MHIVAWYVFTNVDLSMHDSYLFTDWALPDQLVFSTVSALLRLSSSHPQYTEQVTSAITFFIAQTVEKIEGDTCKFR